MKIQLKEDPMTIKSSAGNDSEICFTCQGKKTVEEVCGTCDGDGDVEDICDRCGGRGKMKDGARCPDCYATGWKLYECSTCTGRGSVWTVCPECNGTGFCPEKEGSRR